MRRLRPMTAPRRAIVGKHRTRMRERHSVALDLASWSESERWRPAHFDATDSPHDPALRSLRKNRRTLRVVRFATNGATCIDRKQATGRRGVYCPSFLRRHSLLKFSNKRRDSSRAGSAMVGSDTTRLPYRNCYFRFRAPLRTAITARHIAAKDREVCMQSHSRKSVRRTCARRIGPRRAASATTRHGRRHSRFGCAGVRPCPAP